MSEARTYIVTRMQFEGCVFFPEYQIESALYSREGIDKGTPQTVGRKIDLSRVTEIWTIGKGDRGLAVGVGFRDKDGKPGPKDLPLGDLPIASGVSDFDKIKDMQIYKAFDHLRKLCGAPEPVRFD